MFDPHIIQRVRHHAVRVGPGGVGGPVGARRTRAPPVLLRLVGHDHDFTDALGTQLRHDLGHGETAVQRLPPGHGHRVVVKQLVRHRRPGGDGGTDGQNPRMEIRPIAHVCEDVRRLAERRLTNPGRPLTAHLRKRIGATRRIPLRHKMTPDPGQRAGTLWDVRRRVVRTTRAKCRRALQFDRLNTQRDRLAFLGLKNRQARLNSGTNIGRKRMRLLLGSDQTATNRPRNHCGRMLSVGRQEPILARDGPTTGIRVTTVSSQLAIDLRTKIIAPVVERLLDGGFDQRALFFDDKDFPKSGRKRPHGAGFKWPDNATLEQADAHDRAGRGVETEIVEGLASVEIRFPGGHQAKPGAGRIDGSEIQAVGANVSKRGVAFVVQQPLLLRNWAIRPADVEPPQR